MTAREVFISYSSADRALAEQLALELEYIGITFWRDEIQIGWGELINDKVARGVSESRYVVVLVTDNSVVSGWVRKEVNIALHREAERNENILLPYVFCRPEVAFVQFPDIKVKKFINQSTPFNVAAQQIKELIVGPVSGDFVYNFPSAHSGPVWMRVAGYNLPGPVPHLFEISWGPWYREFKRTLLPSEDVFLRLSKQDNLSLPLRVSVNPPCRISFGIGKPPSGSHSEDINPFWIDKKARVRRWFARTFLWPR